MNKILDAHMKIMRKTYRCFRRRNQRFRDHMVAFVHWKKHAFSIMDGYLENDKDFWVRLMTENSEQECEYHSYLIHH